MSEIKITVIRTGQVRVSPYLPFGGVFLKLRELD